ncbi:MAG: class I SAM-dependent methyltransferase [Legionellaceae bacterium]
MTSKAIYNDFAAGYAGADQFGAIRQSHDVAMQQLMALGLEARSTCKVLDLGVGDGAFLKRLSEHLPCAEFTGLDVSSEMLKRAQQTLPLTTIESSAADVMNFLPAHTQDLVLAHFINAYLPTHTLFSAAHELIRSTGYYSMITTTYDSFPVAQQYLANCIAEGTILSSVVGHYYKSIVKQTTVAASQAELLSAFSRHNFEIVAHQRIELPIVLNSIEELASFGIDGTWFLNSLSIRILPRQFLLNRLKRLFSKIFTFPYYDTHIIDVVLARHASGPHTH